MSSNEEPPSTDLITLTRSVLAEQFRLGPAATGDLTLLLNAIQVTSKFIATNVRKARLINLVGLAGETNVQGEEQKKLDVLADDIMVNALRACGKTSVLVSEERDEAVIIEDRLKGKYCVVFDPLDGSSNIDAGVNIGTIFGIYKVKEGPNSNSPSNFSGIFKKVVLLCLVGFLAWAYQAIQPPPPKICGSKNGPPITASRIQLKDKRHLAYKEFGVPKDEAKHKIIFVHGFDSCRHDVSALTASLSPDIKENQGVYIVSFDRPGYGESDPNPNQTLSSIAFDIEELADQLELGSRFYVVGFSLGGQIVWTCLKFIPHRLQGAALIAPVVNYWWNGIPSNLSGEEFKQQLTQDQWALRVAHYAPWLTYWWNSQKLFPFLSLINHSPKVLSRQDAELIPRIFSIRGEYMAQVRQQGEFESLHRDMTFAFGKWEFEPTDLENPFPKGEASVHLWQGDEDRLVPVALQRHIVKQLPWIKYHELVGAGHMFPFADGIADSVIGALVGE